MSTRLVFALLGWLAFSGVRSPALARAADEPAAAPPGAVLASEPRPVAFESADGLLISADLYAVEKGVRAPLVLLFHQAASNAAEYAVIAPRLLALGWNALAVDSRAGGSMWSRSNRTVLRLGRSADFLSAYVDLEAALLWAKRQGYVAPIIAWGSSYTSALVFRLAAEHAEVGAVLAFSPGEYLGPDEPVRAWAARVTVPVFVTTASGHEVAVARRILDASPAAVKVQVEPRIGVHGSSTLRADRNPEGSAENWEAVERFLRLLPRQGV